jgi:predicted N-acyltransferase
MLEGFDEATRETLRPLEATGYFCAHSLPFCTLPLRWRTFEEYALDMRAGYRRQLEATLADGEESGLHVRRVDTFLPHAPALFALYEQVIDRARYRLERLNRPFFEALDQMLRGESHALL